jgi:hypothetical protein
MRTEEEVYKMVSGAVMSSLKNSGIPAFFIYDENDPRLKEIMVLLHVGYKEKEKKVWRQKTTFDNALENQAMWGGTAAYMRYKMANPDYKIEIEPRYDFFVYNAKKDEKSHVGNLEAAINLLRNMLKEGEKVAEGRAQDSIADLKPSQGEQFSKRPPDVKETPEEGTQKDNIDVLMLKLNSNDRIMRMKAMSALAETAEPCAVVAIIALLKDRDDKIRIHAIHLLGQLKDPRAVDPLIAALEDPNANVRDNAAFVLGQMGDHRAVDPLSIVASKDQSSAVRSTAETALKRLKDSLNVKDGGTSVK